MMIICIVFVVVCFLLLWWELLMDMKMNSYIFIFMNTVYAFDIMKCINTKTNVQLTSLSLSLFLNSW